MTVETESPPQTVSDDQVASTSPHDDSSNTPVAMTVIVKFPEGNELKLLVILM